MAKEKDEVGVRLSYKYRLYPTDEQIHFFNINFGCSRFVYNYFLRQREKAYNRTKKTIRSRVLDDEGKPTYGEDGKMIFGEIINPDYDPTAKSMTFNQTSKLLTMLKKEIVDEEGHRWLTDADSTALVYALRNLDNAYQNFFRRVKKGIKPYGYPKKKKGGKTAQSYTTGNVKVGDNYVILPKVGKVKAKIHRVPKGNVYAATIKRTASGQYFIAVKAKNVIIDPLPENEKEVAVSLGLKKWVTTSTGESIVRPNYHSDLYKKLAREKRKLARKKGNKKGEPKSNNFKKQKIKIAKIEQKIAAKREYETHNLTKYLMNNYGVVFSREMASSELYSDTKKDKKLPNKAKRAINQAIVDANFAEINRQLQYKAEWYGRECVVVPQNAPTTQVCSNCGYKNKIIIKDLKPEWTCPECGAVHDRKYNAAVNIMTAGRVMFEVEKHDNIEVKNLKAPKPLN